MVILLSTDSPSTVSCHFAGSVSVGGMPLLRTNKRSAEVMPSFRRCAGVSALTGRSFRMVRSVCYPAIKYCLMAFVALVATCSAKSDGVASKLPAPAVSRIRSCRNARRLLCAPCCFFVIRILSIEIFLLRPALDSTQLILILTSQACFVKFSA